MAVFVSPSPSPPPAPSLCLRIHSENTLPRNFFPERLSMSNWSIRRDASVFKRSIGLTNISSSRIRHVFTEKRISRKSLIFCQAGKIDQSEFTEMAWQAMVASPEVAKESKHQIVETEHLMKALLEQRNGLARRIFAKANIDNTELLQAKEKFIQRQPKVIGENSGSMLGQDLEALIERARVFKKEYGDSFLSVEHLVLSFSKGKRFGKQLFKDFQISQKALSTAVLAIQGTQKVMDQDPEGKYEALDKYGKDLTEMARQGKLDPVIGRDDEIRRCIQILSRRTKNNPVLIGEPGVGKTAISEGLAQRIVQGDVPQALMNRKLISLDMGALIAGAKYRGEFEDRLKSVLKEVTDSDSQIILFIDEIHTVVGAGATSGAMDAGNLLKPMLGRGELRCIGATTLDEYRKYIEKDPALERRFRFMWINQRYPIPFPYSEVFIQSFDRSAQRRYSCHGFLDSKDSLGSKVVYKEQNNWSKISCLEPQPPLTKIEEYQCFADVQAYFVLAYLKDLVSLEGKKNELEKELGRAPTYKEWAGYVGCSIYNLYARVGKGRAAKRKMIKANLPLVSFIAKEFQGRGLSHRELFQEGAKGLVKSTEKFDISFDTKFSTYSYFWIRQRMSAAVYTLQNLLVMARSAQKTATFVLQCKDEFREINGRNPSMDELSAFSKLNKTKIRESLCAVRSSKALNFQLKDDENRSENLDLEDVESDLSWMKLLQNELKAELRMIFSQLSPRELQVVKMRYGLFGGSPLSLVQELLDDMFSKLDANGDGDIEWVEFRDYFQSYSLEIGTV